MQHDKANTTESVTPTVGWTAFSHNPSSDFEYVSDSLLILEKIVFGSQPNRHQAWFESFLIQLRAGDSEEHPFAALQHA